MTFLSKSITGLGLLFLAHACYSAHEHSALQSIISSTLDEETVLGLGSGGAKTLPIDISIETVVSLVLVCLGLVLGMPELRPIVWRVWAGGIERGGVEGVGADGKESFVGNPFRVLESRPGFVDVRKGRREFAEWVKEGGAVKRIEGS